MANPFYVQPANFMPGYNDMAEKAIAGGVEQKNRSDLDEFSEKFDTMSPKEIAQYTLKHPDIANQIIQSTEMNMTMTKEENLQQAWDVITGKVKPKEAMVQRAQEVINRGGDASHSIALAKDAMLDGDKAMKGAYAYVAANDPQGLNSYMKATGADAVEDTTNIKDWKHYQKLLDEDPDKAEQFGIKSGIIEPQDLPTPTDIDDYVNDAALAYEQQHGRKMPPDLRNKARLEFKRAQAGEVAATRWAERNVDAATAEQIKYNEKLGTRLAEIATQKDLMQAKGEVSPVAKQELAKGRMTTKLAQMTRHYVDLDSMGAILNVDKPTTENLMAALKSSGPGQFLGRITGSDAQSLRSKINKLKPLLMQDIRQATDMSARGLDSEKELEFYLQAATDEKTDIQSNMAAIVVLDESFGTGEVSEQIKELTDTGDIEQIRIVGQQILNGTPVVENQRGYDSLKSGQLYLEKDVSTGKLRQYRKP